MQESPGPARSSGPAALIAALAVGVAVLGAVALRPEPAVAPPPVEVRSWEPKQWQLRLLRKGDHRAQVQVNGEDLGEIAVDAEGKFSGWAIGKLMARSRVLSLGTVEIWPAAGVDPRLAPGIQRILATGGVFQAPIVAPALAPEAE